MWNFMWLDIDSSLQTKDSKWLDSFFDTTLTRPSHDSDSDSTRLEKISDDSDLKGLLRWLDSDSTKMIREHHCSSHNSCVEVHVAQD